MKKAFCLSGFFLLICFCTQAQFTRYIIQFKDKGTNPYSLSNPGQYLTQRALDRRARYNIAIDSSDLPITPRYIDSLRLAGNVTILTASKWLNQVAIRTTDAAALAKINSFPFILSAAPIAARIQPGIDIPVNKSMDSTTGHLSTSTTSRPQDINDYYNYGASNGQVKIHHGDFLHNHGFRGEGMQLCVLDAGFSNYLSIPTFDSVRNNNQILATWDFVANEESVNEDNSHGTHCFSTIAANMPGIFVGTAPKTSFYLFRTEDVNSEYPIEEQNLAAGAERADSLGVDICSISLGYFSFDNSQFNYTFNDFNGNISISARAADMAAKKGLLMVIAMGNEGNSGWQHLITPADADSVLSVGAVDTTGIVGGFSSYGPSSDGQVKPAVAAVGVYAVVANTNDGQPNFGFGTSYACPNMAGITTCLWQAFPEINNMGIIDALELSANRYNNPDDRTGYGVPDAKKAFVILQKRLYTGTSGITDCKPFMQFAIKTDNTMSIVVERKTSTETIYATIATLHDNGPYGFHGFHYEDDLSAIAPGIIHYRLKMMIATDTTFYLDSLTVDHLAFCNTATANNIIIAPNPVYENLAVTITRIMGAKINIVIQNALGQKIYSNEYQQSAGTQVQSIPMRHMSRGAYFVTVYVDNKKTLTKKILKK